MRNLYITSISLFYKNVGVLLGGVSDCEELVGVNWRVSDCEELIGSSSQEMMGEGDY
jgi:hypothetical protein